MSDFCPRTSRDASRLFPRLRATSVRTRDLSLPSPPLVPLLLYCACVDPAPSLPAPAYWQYDTVPVQRTKSRQDRKKNRRKNIFGSVSDFCPRIGFVLLAKTCDPRCVKWCASCLHLLITWDQDPRSRVVLTAHSPPPSRPTLPLECSVRTPWSRKFRER